MVCRSVFRCVLFIFKENKRKGPQKNKNRIFLNEQTERARSKHTRTFGTGQRADRPHGTPTERIVPVGVARGAGGADGQTARSQIHHFFCWRDQRATQPATENRKKTTTTSYQGPAADQLPMKPLHFCVVYAPTFLLLLGRGAARGLVAGLLGHGDGRDDASLAPQAALLLLLLQVLQDVLGPLVGARHRPRREGFLQKRAGGKRG